MRPLRLVVVFLLMLGVVPALVRAQGERIDTAAVARIKAEGLQNSRIMELLSALCDVYSPRLSWSPEYRRGADWVSRRLKEWGMQNISYDYWAPVGKGWSLKNFSAMVTAPVPYPVIAYPAAWSPGFSEKEAEVVFLDARTTEGLEKYRGKLKGKFVLVADTVDVRTRFEPYATRLADSVLLRMANADFQSGRRDGRRGPRGPRLDRLNAQNLDSAIAATGQMFPDADTAAMRRRFESMQASPRRLEFAQKEGAVAAISAGQGNGGAVLVQSASVVRPADAPPGPRMNPYDAKAPEIIPQVVFAAEHYNRIVRMLRQGEKVKLEMELQVATTKADSGFNIIAEIPGTDLKDEVVLLGAHFDTWHAGTGATDDNTGTAACMEAMRILQVLSEKHGLRPRRTVRIGLWGAEEQGLIGSREYVSQTYARRDSGSGGPFPAGGEGESSRRPHSTRTSPSISIMTTGPAGFGASICRETKPRVRFSAVCFPPSATLRRRPSPSKTREGRTTNHSTVSGCRDSSLSRTPSITTAAHTTTRWICTNVFRRPI